MDKKYILLSVLLSSILITVLFHRQALGINLAIFEILFLSFVAFKNQIQLNKKNILIYGLVLLLSLASTIFTHSLFSYIMHFLALFIFIGVLIYPEAKSLISSIGLSFTALIDSQTAFVSELSNSKFKGQKIAVYLWKSRIFVIPVIIIVLFLIIYRNSNPFFDELLVEASTFISQKLGFVFEDLDFLIVLTFLMALFFSNYLIFRKAKSTIIDIDQNSSSSLLRVRNSVKRKFKLTALKNEYKAGVFLLFILNGILLILNAIEVKWVWFNFEWEGQFLKEFVHQGTYLLILSILISIGLVLYFFRGKINFYKANTVLKYLSYLWLAQNAILVISVAIRNYWYIYYFSLAYKRIGVFIFLLLTLYGLYSVLIKVRNRKSSFYLIKKNAFVWFAFITICSFVNWDSVIASYNFKNADRAFLHLDYMSTLSDKTLPILSKDLNELEQLNQDQKEKFPFDVVYLTPSEYNQKVIERKYLFIEEWESKSILSWNLPEYRAYKELTTGVSKP